jgi:hypothetical protein
MSVQLILYPQSYQGAFNAISTDPNEFVVNGINFSNPPLSTSSSYDTLATTLAINVSLIAQPAVTNTWVRYRSTPFGTPALPTNTSNNVVFNSGAFSSRSGIYQKLSNLVIGQLYNITINVSTTGTGSIHVGVYNISSIVTGQTFSATTSTITGTFTATSSANTLVVSYLNTVATNVTVSNISVVPTGIQPSGAIQLLDDGQVILDLYEDENIPLTLSVDDFKNVAEKVQSYSKAFNLPATKRNNQIFENLFELTRSAQNFLTFNPYAKTKSVLKQDGFTLFEGYLRVLDIQDKEGEISYNVNLYSEVISFADTLKDKTFSQLDFTELEHDYNKTNIKLSWNDSPDPPIAYTNSSTSGFRDGNTTVKYPFVDWTHQILIAAPGGTPTAGNPQLVNLEQAFRPFIQITYLIQRIFQDTEFTFESAFFGSTDFKSLYMDFNWGSETDGSQEDASGTLVQDINSSSWVNENSYTAASRLVFDDYVSGNLTANWDATNSKFSSPVNNLEVTCTYLINLKNTSSFTTYSNSVRIAIFNSGGGLVSVLAQNTNAIGSGNTKVFQGTLNTVLQYGQYIQAQATSLTDDKIGFFPSGPSSGDTFISFTATNTAQQVSTLLNKMRGELGQWEFLKGIMTMFNLIASPDKSNPNNIIIEPYKDMFLPSITGTNNFFDDNSTQLDWTNKIDTTEIKLEVLADLNKRTVFKFVEDDDDYAFNLYKTAVQGHLYGSQVFDASTTTGNLQSVLEGEEEIEATPFAATVPKPLMSQFPDLIVPSVYSYNPDDLTSEGFENSPRIMYNNGIKSLALGTFTSCTYYIPEQNGAFSENADAFLQFSHLTDIPTVVTNPPVSTDTVDFHFGLCQLIQPIGDATPNNLFNTYWLPYFNELYNPDTRTMTLKVNLTPGDINTFFFYNTVFIKNRLFRVNKIDYKPNELATVEFILIP